MIFLGVCIITAVFLPGKMCYSRDSVAIWPAFWGIFSVVESCIMIIYLRWLIDELKTHNVNSRNKLSKSVLRDLEGKDRERHLDQSVVHSMTDASFDSVTTI